MAATPATLVSAHASPDAAEPVLLFPDIFTIVAFNDHFQLALDDATIPALLLVCKRARLLLSSRLSRFDHWCQGAGLCRPDGQLRIGLTPSDRIAISLHCDDPAGADRSWLVALADKGRCSASYLLGRILQSEIKTRAEDNDDTHHSSDDDDDEDEDDDDDDDDDADDDDASDDTGSASDTRHDSRRRLAFYYVKKAADAGHPVARFYMAECCHNGYGTKRDTSKAAELYRSLADRGYAPAQVGLGRCLENVKSFQGYTTAIEWYTKAVSQGSDSGRLHIVFLRGWFSLVGHGVGQSDADALKCWQEVSTQSTDIAIKSIATHMVGWMHYLGRGVERDQQKGVKIIRENESDEFLLGELDCRTEEDFQYCDSLAARKFFKLCRLGSKQDWLCRHLMAVCLIHSFGVTQNHDKAARIFEQLANENHSDSQYWLGQCHYGSWGKPRNYSKAFEWFSKSADQGNPYGQWMVGHSYYHHGGVSRDLAKAVEWYRKAAEQGHRQAQYDLGFCYGNGYGVARDWELSTYWSRKSFAQHR